MSTKQNDRLFTKEEALAKLSMFIRKTKDAQELLKLIALTAKIAGWGKEGTPPEGKPDLDKLIADAERKRKEAQAT